MAKTSEVTLEVIMGEESIEVIIDDIRYSIGALTIDDFALFRSWVKKSRLAIFMEAAKEAKLPPRQFGEGIAQILSVSSDEDGGDPVLSEMSTEEGMRYLLWLGIRKNHPEFLMSDFRIQFHDIIQLSKVFARISGFTLPEDAQKCSSCDATITDNTAKFCIVCGTEVVEINPPTLLKSGEEMSTPS